MSDPVVINALNNLSTHIDALTRRVSVLEQVVDSHHKTIAMLGGAVESLNTRLNQLQPPNPFGLPPQSRMQL